MANVERSKKDIDPQKAAKKVKKTREKAKKARKTLEQLKNVKALAPIISALSTILIVIVIILLIIGFIGFFTTLPGLAVDKFLEVCNNFWRWVWRDQSVQFDSESVDDLANYIQDMGYDLVSYGFASPGTVTKDEENGKITVDWSGKRKFIVINDADGRFATDEYGNAIYEDKTVIQNLYGYILANERTYTIQGTDKYKGIIDYGFKHLPFGGRIIDQIDTGIRSLWVASDPSKYGMLDFKKMSDWDDGHTDISIDRKNKQMTITSHTGFLSLGRDQFKFDLSGWTSRYGKPIELSLALHLATMSPDFVYDFCADNQLQTKVELNTTKITYNMEYYYQATSSDGVPIGEKVSSSKIIEKFNSINSEQINRINGIFSNDIRLGEASDTDVMPTNFKCYGLLYDDCIISVKKEGEDNVVYYRAVDENGNNAFNIDTLNWNRTYQVKFKSDGQPYFIEVNNMTDSFFVTDIFSKRGIDVGDKIVCVEMLSLKMLSRFPVSLIGKNILEMDKINKDGNSNNFDAWNYFRSEFFGRKGEGSYNIHHTDKDTKLAYLIYDRYYSFFRNIDSLINSSKDVDANKVEKLELDVRFNEYKFENTQITDEDGNLTENYYDKIIIKETKKYGEEINHNAMKIFSEIRNYIWDNRDNDKKSRAWGLYDSFFGINGEDGFIDYLRKEVEQIKFTDNEDLNDINYLKMLVLFSDSIQADLAKWRIDELAFVNLYQIFRSQKKSVTTYEPHIDYVLNHWYKDLDFTKSAYTWVTDTAVSDPKKYQPEGPAEDDRMKELEKNGDFYYTSQTNDKHIVQTGQPTIDKTRPWHYKVKNWIKYGYYFIYDGTEETARRIETARKVLSLPGLIEAGYTKEQAEELQYDLTNPLLIKIDNSQQEDLYNGGVRVEDIEKKAKKLNEILARTDVYLPKTLDLEKRTTRLTYNFIPITENGTVKDIGVGGVRLQRIDFEKKSSLTAFSILEGMHTKDSEYIYRDLKEFLIELEYFTKADFEEIETDVFKWIIPKYQVYKEEWPDPKFEKRNMEYGSYIRSESSLAEQRDDIEKAAKESSKSVSNSSISGYFTTSGDGYNSVTEVNGIYYKNFKQGSGSYAYKPYWGSGTMAGDGCGPTSAAIMLSGYGLDTSPYDVAQIITRKYGDYTNSYNLVSALKDLNFKAVNHSINGTNDTESIKAIEDALKQGKPVMIAGAFPSQHWICLIGIKNGEAIISDPATGIASLNSYVRGNNGYITVKELVEKYTFAGSYIIPDKVPNGITINQVIQGFKDNLEVIAPESGKIIEIGEEKNEEKEQNAEDGNQSAESKDYFKTNGKYLIIEFNSNNGVAGWKMKIEGINITVNEGDLVQQGDKIGTTTTDNIKIVLLDKKDAIINDVEDYFKLKKRKNVSRESQEYQFTEDEIYLLAQMITVESEPGVIASLMDGDEEIGMLAGKATGYVCINAALRDGLTIEECIDYPHRYEDRVAIKNATPTAKALECAEWCARYDCTSIQNPDTGVPMSKHVTGQSGWDLCMGSDTIGKPKNLNDLTCWWIIDFKGRGTYGKIEDFDDIGYNCDAFYCYDQLP